MDEAGARQWLVSAFNVSRETLQRLDRFVELLREENGRQNLVSAASLDHVWGRHIVDSAQLLFHARDREGPWLDLGTGAGFPGLIVALLYPGPVTMIDERKKRTAFLEEAASVLALPEETRIVTGRAETAELPPADVISARAFAPLDRLLTIGQRFATPGTRWVLPKGRNAKSELDAARSSWQGEFSLEASLTDPDAQIVVAEGVSRRAKGKHR
jgi:16S rRNA (guanine527-N7)-methyltransferase